MNGMKRHATQRLRRHTILRDETRLLPGLAMPDKLLAAADETAKLRMPYRSFRAVNQL
jgi:hypothetical protein